MKQRGLIFISLRVWLIEIYLKNSIRTVKLYAHAYLDTHIIHLLSIQTKDITKIIQCFFVIVVPTITVMQTRNQLSKDVAELDQTRTYSRYI